MLFCSPEYLKNLSIEAREKPWFDSWEFLLSLSKTACREDGWLLVAFFLHAPHLGEYVLGPHWGEQAPFIRRKENDPLWHNAVHLKEPVKEVLANARWTGGTMPADGSRLCQYLISLSPSICFFGLGGENQLAEGEAQCWEELVKRYPLNLPDLYPSS